MGNGAGFASVDPQVRRVLRWTERVDSIATFGLPAEERVDRRCSEVEVLEQLIGRRPVVSLVVWRYRSDAAELWHRLVVDPRVDPSNLAGALRVSVSLAAGVLLMLVQVLGIASWGPQETGIDEARFLVTQAGQLLAFLGLSGMVVCLLRHPGECRVRISAVLLACGVAVQLATFQPLGNVSDCFVLGVAAFGIGGALLALPSSHVGHSGPAFRVMMAGCVPMGITDLWWCAKGVGLARVAPAVMVVAVSITGAGFHLLARQESRRAALTAIPG